MNDRKENIIFLRSVASTSDYLKLRPPDRLSDGLAVVAEEQTQGRGRGARTWFSPKHLGLYVSAVFLPNVSSSDVGLYHLAGALAVVRSIAKCGGTGARIKWPNDILINERKVAGMLIETKIQHNLLRQLIVGVGINLYHQSEDFPSDLRATSASILSESGVRVNREELLLKALTNLRSFYNDIKNRTLAEAALIRDWQAMCAHLDRPVHVPAGEAACSGIFRGVDRSGAGLIETRDGLIQKIFTSDLVQESDHAFNH